MLEHVLSEELEELIAAKLGDPTHDPHGDPIPTRDLHDRRAATRALDALEAGRARTLRARLGLRPRDAALPRRARHRARAHGSRSSTRQPFGGPLFAALRRDDVHVLGGALAAAMRVEVGLVNAARGDRAAGAGARRRRGRHRRPGADAQRAAAAALARAAARHAAAARAGVRRRRIAYVDPGNFATNIAGGAKYGYLLLWVMLAANLMAMLIQNLSAKIGIATGKNLPELCREHFPRPRHLGPVGAGRADRDGDRPGRVRRRGDRAEPAVRRAAVRRRADHRGRRVRRSSRCRAAATAASSW